MVSGRESPVPVMAEGLGGSSRVDYGVEERGTLAQGV